MCDPITAVAIASAVATAGGNYMQTRANNKSQQAMTNARNEAAAQGVKEQQPNIQAGQDMLNQTIQKFGASNQADNLGSLVASRKASIDANNAPGASDVSGPAAVGAAPQVVKSDLADKMGKAAAYAGQQGDALARTSAVGDLFQNNTTSLNDNAINLQNLNKKANEEKNVNLMKQTADANNARKSPSSFGQILSTLGAAGSMASAGAGAASLLGAGGAAGAGSSGLASSLWSSFPQTAEAVLPASTIQGLSTVAAPVGVTVSDLAAPLSSIPITTWPG